MPRITYIDADGGAHVIEAEVGTSIMQAAVENLVPGILGDCGGACSCATCHAYVESIWMSKLAPPSEGEISMLDGSLGVQENSRLTCQIKMTESLDGIVLRLPAEQY